MSVESPDPIARLKELISRHQDAVAATQEAARKVAEQKAQQPEGNKS
ncbi:MAG: hypothetical protein ACREHG_02400 [Candidatus Saccharimonadales bacterium]